MSEPQLPHCVEARRAVTSAVDAMPKMAERTLIRVDDVDFF